MIANIEHVKILEDRISRRECETSGAGLGIFQVKLSQKIFQVRLMHISFVEGRDNLSLLRKTLKEITYRSKRINHLSVKKLKRIICYFIENFFS
jgi:hypothetical protein